MTEPNLEDLKKRAAELDVDGRSSMTKAELVAAIAAAEDAAAGDSVAADTTLADTVEPPAADGSDSGRPPLVDVAEDRARKREDNRRALDAAVTPQEG